VEPIEVTATSEAGALHQRQFADVLHGWGVGDLELLTGDEARYRFPYLSPEIIQARFRQADGWLDPKRLTLDYPSRGYSVFVSPQRGAYSILCYTQATFAIKVKDFAGKTTEGIGMGARAAAL